MNTTSCTSVSPVTLCSCFKTLCVGSLKIENFTSQKIGDRCQMSQDYHTFWPNVGSLSRKDESLMQALDSAKMSGNPMTFNSTTQFLASQVFNY